MMPCDSVVHLALQEGEEEEEEQPQQQRRRRRHVTW